MKSKKKTLVNQAYKLKVGINKFFRSLSPRVSTDKTIKIKIVAIAKDEASYLPEWIFHHLYFGFDTISIYVNNTTDNTAELKAAFQDNTQINWYCGDKYFQQSSKSAQIAIYEHELKLSRSQKYSHVMFLDIDEFWTPLNLDCKVKDFIQSHSQADVFCFEWFNRTNEEFPFMPAISERLKGYCGHHVKSIVSTNQQYERINPHVAISANANYIFADGTKYVFNLSEAGRVSKKQQWAPLKAVFILHRMLRSEEEYLAILSRGRPYTQPEKSSIFKNNRDGYLSNKGDVSHNFPKEELNHYCKERELFYQFYQLHEIINKAHAHVAIKKLELIELIKNSPIEEVDTLKKILKEVTSSEVHQAYLAFKQRHNII